MSCIPEVVARLCAAIVVITSLTASLMSKSICVSEYLIPTVLYKSFFEEIVRCFQAKNALVEKPEEQFKWSFLKAYKVPNTI